MYLEQVLIVDKAVVALRSDETNNPQSEEAEYQHINVLHTISQVVMSDVRKLRNELVLSQTDSGDAISALVVAIQMIKETCKKVSRLDCSVVHFSPEQADHDG